MKFKKLLCIFSLILSLFMLSIFRVEAEEDKILEITLPLESVNTSAYQEKLTLREFMVIEFCMNSHTFYNPETNQALFERYSNNQEFYVIPVDGASESDFTFTIPDEWYNRFGPLPLLNGYSKIRIKFESLSVEPSTEIVCDFSKYDSYGDLTMDVASVFSLLMDENNDYPIAVKQNESGEVQLVNRDSNKVLAIVNANDFSITIPDDVSYEDNTSFDVETPNAYERMDVRKTSFIFAKKRDGDILEITLPLNSVDINNYIALISLRENHILQQHLLPNDIFYNPRTKSALFEIHKSNNNFYVIPDENLDESEFIFAIPDSWYNTSTYSEALDGYNRIKFNFVSTTEKPITEIILDFSKEESVLDLSAALESLVVVIENNENYPIALLFDEENNVVKFINRESQKVLAIINKSDYSITIPDDVTYKDNINFIINGEDIGLENEFKISFIFQESKGNESITNPATFRNSIFLLLLIPSVLYFVKFAKFNKVAK